MVEVRYIYAIQILGTPFVKIGYAWNPQVRVKRFISVLKTHGLTAQVIATTGVAAGNVGVSERLVHLSLAPYHVHLEWYYASLDTIHAAFAALPVVVREEPHITRRLFRYDIPYLRQLGRLP